MVASPSMTVVGSADDVLALGGSSGSFEETSVSSLSLLLSGTITPASSATRFLVIPQYIQDAQIGEVLPCLFALRRSVTLLALQNCDEKPARVLEMRVDAYARSCRCVMLSTYTRSVGCHARTSVRGSVHRRYSAASGSRAFSTRRACLGGRFLCRLPRRSTTCRSND